LSTGAKEVRKRVAFLFAHLHKGGMQKAASNISCALPDRIQQSIVFFGTENPGFEYNATMVDLAVPGSMHTGAIRKAMNFGRRLSLLQRYIDDNHIDTVVSFGEAANVLNGLTRRKRTVISVRGSINDGLTDTGIYAIPYRILVKRLYRRANVVIPVSEALSDQLYTQYDVPREKMQVIYNLYDTRKILAAADEPLPVGLESVYQCPVVVTVGSLVTPKGHEYLIRAFARARESVPDLQLVLVGEGELEHSLRALAHNEGVANGVHFAGFDTNPYRYLRPARMFVLASRFEGFPNALAEAMICGLPVIATDCKTGPREILGNSEHGILLPDITCENSAIVERDIAAAIVRLMNPNCAYHYGELARLRAAEFSQERLIGEWVAVL